MQGADLLRVMHTRRQCMNKIILFLCLLLIHSNALAYKKAQELLWACKPTTSTATTKEILRKVHCIGYITGILDGIPLVFAIRPESRFFCSPTGGISAGQQVRIVVKYLEDNPEKLHDSARMQALLALAQAFPCKASPNAKGNRNY